MAIKRSKTKKSNAIQLPEKLDSLLRDGFTCAVLQKKFEADGKEIRNDIITYLETNKDGFEIEVSKSFKTEYGTVNFKQRQNFEVDKDKLIELVNDGKVTIETLIHLGSFAGAKLREAGCAEAVSEADPTEYLELGASKEFKEKVDEMWASGDFAEAEEVEEIKSKSKPKSKPKKAAPKVDAKEDVKARARAAAAAARAKFKTKAKISVEDDLDAILGQ